MKDPSGMYKVYKIVDNETGKSYVGSTGEYYLCRRLHTHRRDKKSNKGCSSAQLDLYNCELTLIEKVSHEKRKEREAYWIENTDCVNIRKLKGCNKERKRETSRQYYQKHKERINEKARLKRKKIREEKLKCVQDLEIKS
tara:strand:- start:19 stop:438 length:420 start_codon:yes stop_codon:yes gene_type:complete